MLDDVLDLLAGQSLLLAFDTEPEDLYLPYKWSTRKLKKNRTVTNCLEEGHHLLVEGLYHGEQVDLVGKVFHNIGEDVGHSAAGQSRTHGGVQLDLNDVEHLEDLFQTEVEVPLEGDEVRLEEIHSPAGGQRLFKVGY